jgi:hypothetical protein
MLPNKVALSQNLTLIVRDSGQVYYQGTLIQKNLDGQVFSSKADDLFQPVYELSNVVDISTTPHNYLAVNQAGDLLCFDYVDDDFKPYVIPTSNNPGQITRVFASTGRVAVAIDDQIYLDQSDDGVEARWVLACQKTLTAAYVLDEWIIGLTTEREVILIDVSLNRYHHRLQGSVKREHFGYLLDSLPANNLTVNDHFIVVTSDELTSVYHLDGEILSRCERLSGAECASQLPPNDSITIYQGGYLIVDENGLSFRHHQVTQELYVTNSSDFMIFVNGARLALVTTNREVQLLVGGKLVSAITNAKEQISSSYVHRAIIRVAYERRITSE